MISIEQEKDRLRRELRRARNALSPEWREGASRRITDNLLAWNQFISMEVIHSYLSWRSEVTTAELIKHIWGMGKKVVAPRVDILHHILEHFYIQEFNNVLSGAFGIPEPDPLHCKPARTKDLQLIIVPGVGFDRRGNRLGSGHGFYDHFLAQTSAVRVGLAFSMQMIDHVPVGGHDQKMDFVVTEDELIACDE